MTKIKFKKNFLGGIFSLVLGLLLLMILIPSQVEVSNYIHEVVDSTFVPKLIAYLFCIFGLILIFKSLILKEDTPLVVSLSTELNILLYFLILVGYVLLIKYIGFFFSCLLMGIATLVFLRTRKVTYYLATVLTFLVSYFIFVYFLKVPLPTIIGQYI